MADRDAGPALVGRESRGPVDVLAVRAAEIYRAADIEGLGRHLRQAIEASDARAFVLDLAAVRFLTSAALGLIIHLHAQLGGRGYGFAVAAARGEVAKIFATTGLARAVPVCETVDDAVERLRCPASCTGPGGPGGDE